MASRSTTPPALHNPSLDGLLALNQAGRVKALEAVTFDAVLDQLATSARLAADVAHDAAYAASGTVGSDARQEVNRAAVEFKRRGARYVARVGALYEPNGERRQAQRDLTLHFLGAIDHFRTLLRSMQRRDNAGRPFPRHDLPAFAEQGPPSLRTIQPLPFDVGAWLAARADLLLDMRRTRIGDDGRVLFRDWPEADVPTLHAYSKDAARWITAAFAPAGSAH